MRKSFVCNQGLTKCRLATNQKVACSSHAGRTKFFLFLHLAISSTIRLRPRTVFRGSFRSFLTSEPLDSAQQKELTKNGPRPIFWDDANFPGHFGLYFRMMESKKRNLRNITWKTRRYYATAWLRFPGLSQDSRDREAATAGLVPQTPESQSWRRPNRSLDTDKTNAPSLHVGLIDTPAFVGRFEIVAGAARVPVQTSAPSAIPSYGQRLDSVLRAVLRRLVKKASTGGTSARRKG